MSNILDFYRKDPLSKEVLFFLSSLKEDLWILEEDVLGTIAHTLMLKNQQIISNEDARKIITELINIYNDIKSGKFKVIEGIYEDIHPYIENIIIERLGLDIGGKIHSGRSRNDQVALDIRLKVRKELINFHKSLNNLLESLISLAKKTIDIFCPLYTHMQQAQLGTFAHIILNYASQISRLIERIEFCFNSINYNPLGACAIGGTSFPIDRNFTTKLLGFNGTILNSIDAISSRDDFLMILMFLTLGADIFTRMCEDLIIFSSKEFNFIELNDAYTSVSSVLPQKKNPDTLEIIRGKMGRVYSSLNHLLFVSKGIPSGYYRDFQETKVCLQISFNIIIESTNILTGVFNTLKINKESMEKYLNESMILALDLAEYIVKNTNLSFRESHGLIGNLVKTHKNFDEILNKNLIEENAIKLFNKKIVLNQDILNSFKNFEYILNLRISEGSPNKIQIDNLIKILSNNLKKFKDFVDIKLEFLSSLEKNIIIMANKLIDEKI